MNSGVQWGVRAISAAVLGVLGVGALAVPGATAAAEQPATLCTDLWNQREGIVANVAVVGDLIVDGSCYILRSSVTGDVVVPAGQQVVLSETVVDGDVRASGRAALLSSIVDGAVELDGAGTAVLRVEGGTVRDVRGAAREVTFAAGARLTGTYDVTAGEMHRLQGSTFVGPVTARDGRLLTHGSTFGDVTAIGSRDAIVCRTTVTGDLTVTALADYARIGLEGRERCGVTIGGSLVLRDNPHSVDLGEVAIARDLVCVRNSGPRVVSGTPAFTEGSRVTVGRVSYGDCWYEWVWI
ncbi:hypothetical protein [Cellulomonas cellasea]|uniref:Uncharacterized protein n=1 Tax=Cellulomonas cellasea TaxID=43670 RepID=A0A7W4UHU2_9CELL|nr:hypothetical protein [Cellulomonas cellasea]MBB2924436.1 hypothetical protein [Cellulomonas cellasea]